MSATPEQREIVRVMAERLNGRQAAKLREMGGHTPPRRGFSTVAALRDVLADSEELERLKGWREPYSGMAICDSPVCEPCSFVRALRAGDTHRER